MDTGINQLAIKAASDEAAFAELIATDQLASMIDHAAQKACRANETEPEDAKQILTMALWKSLKVYDPARAPFHGFAATILRNHVVNIWIASRDTKMAKAGFGLVSLDSFSHRLADETECNIGAPWIGWAEPMIEDSPEIIDKLHAKTDLKTLLDKIRKRLSKAEKIALEALRSVEGDRHGMGKFPAMLAWIKSHRGQEWTTKQLDNAICRLTRKARKFAGLTSSGIEIK